MGFPAQSQISLFLEYPFPGKSVVMSLKKKMAESVTRDMTSSDWLKLVALCLFRAQSESKINQFVTVLGQDHKVIDQHYFLIHSCARNSDLHGCLWLFCNEQPSSQLGHYIVTTNIFFNSSNLSMVCLSFGKVNSATPHPLGDQSMETTTYLRIYRSIYS